MYVHVDETRGDYRAGRVEERLVFAHCEVLADFVDDAAYDADVAQRIERERRIDQPAALDQQTAAVHRLPLTRKSRTAMRIPTPLRTCFR